MKKTTDAENYMYSDFLKDIANSIQVPKFSDVCDMLIKGMIHAINNSATSNIKNPLEEFTKSLEKHAEEIKSISQAATESYKNRFCETLNVFKKSLDKCKSNYELLLNRFSVDMQKNMAKYMANSVHGMKDSIIEVLTESISASVDKAVEQRLRVLVRDELNIFFKTHK